MPAGNGRVARAAEKYYRQPEFQNYLGYFNRHPNFYEIFGDGANMMPNDNAGTFFDIADRGTWESGTQFDFSLNWQGKMLKSDRISF